MANPDYGKICGRCGQSELGIERLKSFGFKVSYCKDCDPDAPPKPPPIEINMDMCDVHEALSVDRDTGRCGLCDHDERLKRLRRERAAMRSKKRNGR